MPNVAPTTKPLSGFLTGIAPYMDDLVVLGLQRTRRKQPNENLEQTLGESTSKQLRTKHAELTAFETMLRPARYFSKAMNLLDKYNAAHDAASAHLNNVREKLPWRKKSQKRDEEAKNA